MTRFNGPRGLAGYARFATTYGVTIEVQESSAVACGTHYGLILGPFLWLRLFDDGTGAHVFAHLGEREAIELRDALNAWIDDISTKEAS